MNDLRYKIIGSVLLSLGIVFLLLSGADWMLLVGICLFAGGVAGVARNSK